MLITRSFLLPFVLVTAMFTPAFAADDAIVNGYTYVTPSVYLAPPVVVYDPFFAVPTHTVIIPLGYTSPVVYAEPTFVSQAVVPYAPAWNFEPVRIGPSAYRERARFGRHGMEYTYREYVPGRAAPVYSYRVDPGRRGVRIRERFR